MFAEMPLDNLNGKQIPRPPAKPDFPLAFPGFLSGRSNVATVETT